MGINSFPLFPLLCWQEGFSSGAAWYMLLELSELAGGGEEDSEIN